MDDEESSRLRGSIYAACAIGVVVGLVAAATVLLWGGHGIVGTSARGLLLTILAVGVPAGMAMQAAVERVSGVCGAVLLIPMGLGAVVAMATAAAAWGGLDELGGPGGGGSLIVVGIAGVMWVTAAIQTVSERLR